MTALALFQKKLRPGASVVDGKLILSLPGAIKPVVWQMDLTQARSSALEIANPSENGPFVLTLKTPKGESLDVAPFANQQDALDALMTTAKALERAHGQIRPAPALASAESAPVYSTAPGPKKGRAGRWIGGILIVLLIFFLFNMWASLRALPPQSMNSGPATSAPAGNAPAGVPLSADEFLNAQ